MTKCPGCGFDNIDGADQCEQCHGDLFEHGRPEAQLHGLGQRLLNDSVMSLDPGAAVTVVPEQTIAQVVQTMCDDQVSAVLVVHHDEMVGIFTERDFLLKIADRYELLKDQPVRRFMTASPESLETSDSIAFGLNLMAVKHFRHIPILKAGQVTALVQTRDVLDYLSRNTRNVQ